MYFSFATYYKFVCYYFAITIIVYHIIYKPFYFIENIINKQYNKGKV